MGKENQRGADINIANEKVAPVREREGKKGMKMRVLTYE